MHWSDYESERSVRVIAALWVFIVIGGLIIAHYA